MNTQECYTTECYNCHHLLLAFSICCVFSLSRLSCIARTTPLISTISPSSCWKRCTGKGGQTRRTNQAERQGGKTKQEEGKRKKESETVSAHGINTCLVNAYETHAREYTHTPHTKHICRNGSCVCVSSFMCFPAAFLLSLPSVRSVVSILFVLSSHPHYGLLVLDLLRRRLHLFRPRLLLLAPVLERHKTARHCEDQPFTEHVRSSVHGLFARWRVRVVGCCEWCVSIVVIVVVQVM